MLEVNLPTHLNLYCRICDSEHGFDWDTERREFVCEHHHIHPLTLAALYSTDGEHVGPLDILLPERMR